MAEGAPSQRYGHMDWFESPSGGPRWRHVKPFLLNIHPDRRQDTIDALCIKYPPWFFELLTEVKIDQKLELEGFQIGYLLDESKLKITNKTRQAGGSLVVSMAKFFEAYKTEGYKCEIVSITRGEAQGKIDYIRSLWESLPMRWRSPLAYDNTERIGFHSGRARSSIKSVAASAGVRGGQKDIVFDEAAHIGQFASLYTAALPATVRDGRFDIISTPLGQSGKFYEIWTSPVAGDGDDEYQYSRHEFAWWDVSFFCTDIKEARRVWEEEFEEDHTRLYELLDMFGTANIKRIVANLTSEEYYQEFCCVFVDESDAYYPYGIIEPIRKHAEKQPNNPDVLIPWTKRPDGNENVVAMGVDFAQGRKGGDSTSIQIVEEDDDKVWKHRFYEDLNHASGHTTFGAQLNRIDDIIGRFNPTHVRVDGTGLGMKLAEDLKMTWGNLIEVVTFNNNNKAQMAINMKTLMERQNLWIQYENERLRGQIHNIKRQVTANGSITYSGHPHDDMFWALALACKNDSFGRFRLISIDGEIS
jgi:phage FluMu gp28-like protein